MSGITDFDSLRRAMAENSERPEGPARNARAEELLAEAERLDIPLAVIEALGHQLKVYNYSSEKDKMFVPFARLLRMWDERPEDFDEYETHSLHWVFKWVSSGMLDQPHVPLASIEKWLGEMEHRYRLAGHSERAVRSAEFSVAAHIGDLERAERAYAAWLAADRDQMADCHACELHGQGWWQAERGRDAQALELWRPVLQGEFTCAHEPHTVLASSLAPLLRLGRADEARANHLRGFRLVRTMESMRGAYADHVEFCALTGNEARGLELLAERPAYFTDDGHPRSRLDFMSVVALLMERLTGLGLGGRRVPGPAGRTWTARELAAHARAEALALAARFDRRNGTSYVSERTRARMAQQPLADRLPLGVRSSRPAPAAPVADPVAERADEPEPAALLAEARRLSDTLQPRAVQAWAAAARATEGAELDPRDRAEIADHRAMELGPEGAAQFERAAELFAAAGDPGEALAARARAAHVRALTGHVDEAAETIAGLYDEVLALYAEGGTGLRQTASVLMGRARILMRRVHEADGDAEGPVTDDDFDGAPAERDLAGDGPDTTGRATAHGDAEGPRALDERFDGTPAERDLAGDGPDTTGRATAHGDAKAPGVPDERFDSTPAERDLAGDGPDTTGRATAHGDAKAPGVPDERFDSTPAERGPAGDGPDTTGRATAHGATEAPGVPGVPGLPDERFDSTPTERDLAGDGPDTTGRATAHGATKAPGVPDERFDSTPTGRGPAGDGPDTTGRATAHGATEAPGVPGVPGVPDERFDSTPAERDLAGDGPDTTGRATAHGDAEGPRALDERFDGTPAGRGPAGDGPGTAGGAAAGVVAEAESAVREVLALVDGRTGDDVRLAARAAEAQAMLADLAARAGDVEAAVRLFARAAAAFVAAGLPWFAVEYEARQAQLTHHLGDVAEAERALRAALEHGGGHLEASGRARLHLQLAETLGAKGLSEEAAEHALEAAHWADEAGEGRTLGAWARHQLGGFLLRHGRWAEAAEVLESALPDLSARTHGEGAIVQTQWWLGDCLSELGEHREAAERRLQAAEIARHWPEQHDHATLAHLAAESLGQAGLPVEADRAYARAGDLWRSLGNVHGVVRSLRARAWLALHAEDGADEARGLMEAAVRECERALAAADDEEARERLVAELGHTHRQFGDLLARSASENAEDGAIRAAFEEALSRMVRAVEVFAGLGDTALHSRTGAELAAGWLEADLSRPARAVARARAVLAVYDGAPAEDEAAQSRRAEAEQMLQVVEEKRA